MRRILALGLLLAGACFEDTNPVDETGAMQSSSSGECVAGTEGCPCIDGECVGGLECFSNVCVDAGATSMATSGPEDTSATSTSTTGPMTSTSVGTTPPMTTDETLDSGPMTTDSSGDLPQGAMCDPFFDQCAPGLACVGLGMEGLVCDVPGVGEQGSACDKIVCGPGLLCMQAEVLPMCMSMVACCTAMCDLGSGGQCPEMLQCQPFYPMGMAPAGYENLGVCGA